MSQKQTRQQIAAIRRLFRQNRGAARELAISLRVSPTSVSQWLRGKVTSARIAAAATRRAEELSASSGGAQEPICIANRTQEL